MGSAAVPSPAPPPPTNSVEVLGHVLLFVISGHPAQTPLLVHAHLHRLLVRSGHRHSPVTWFLNSYNTKTTRVRVTSERRTRSRVRVRVRDLPL
jgi:hypothetical protein